MKRTVALALMFIIIATGFTACKKNNVPDNTTVPVSGSDTPPVSAPDSTTPQVSEPAATTAPASTTVPSTTAAATSDSPDTGSPAPQLEVAYAKELWDSAGSTKTVLAAFIMIGAGNSLPEKEYTRMLSFIGAEDSGVIKTTAESGGWEWYLLVPRFKGSSIRVYSVSTETQKPDKLLAETDKPVLLYCNTSDIMPSVYVELSVGGADISASPSVSLRDGSLLAGDGFLALYSSEIGSGK